VNLVLVPVTVTDENGMVVVGLDRSKFTVLEDGVPQQIAAFSSEDLPVSIGLVLDISGSMKQKLDVARPFIRALLAGTDADDETMLLTFADRPDLRVELTRNPGSLENTLQSIRPGGWTALIDSAYLMIERIRAAANPRKVIVIVSDGQDNHSRHSRRELMSRAIESEAQIYTVATREPPGTRKAIQLVEENQGIALLDDLARSTGGLPFQIGSSDRLAEVAEKISHTLHHQYVIGYYPATRRRDGVRRIQVKLALPRMRLYARNRYYAGPGS
jgi:Ca-activated chloride channel family protein